MKLTITFKQYSETISTCINQGDQLRKALKNVSDEAGVEKIEEDYIQWKSGVKQTLVDSFDDSDFSLQFQRATVAHALKAANWRTKKQDLTNILITKCNWLEQHLNLISVSDAIISPELVDLEKRQSYETDEIIQLLLYKLADLYGKGSYSIREILEGNGIKLRTQYEDRDLAEYLEEHELAYIEYSNEPQARLRLRGMSLVEQDRKEYYENYDDLSKSEKEIERILVEIKDHLRDLSMGQEVIYEELEEIKTAYPQLNRRNWGQLVKGKLLDLGLAKLLDKDTIESIYEALTGHDFRLPPAQF